MQCVSALIYGEIERMLLPSPGAYVVGKLRWGNAAQTFTPAYWAVQCWLAPTSRRKNGQRIGRSFGEEMAACILGGYGVPAEVGYAAFRHLRDKGLLEPGRASRSELSEALAAPIPFKGRHIRYRFARQKARYLTYALRRVAEDSPDTADAIYLRQWLLTIKGIGPKTASWIVRNWLSSDEIAILDVHLRRAGLLTGFFSLSDSVKNYLEMERKFIAFAEGIGVRASRLDAVIWAQMRQFGGIAVAMLPR